MPAEDLSLEKNASLKDRKPPGLATNSTLSLPCGADHNSMPFGIQLIATFHADEYLPWSVQYRKGKKFSTVPRPIGERPYSFEIKSSMLSSSPLSRIQRSAFLERPPSLRASASE